MAYVLKGMLGLPHSFPDQCMSHPNMKAYSLHASPVPVSHGLARHCKIGTYDGNARQHFPGGILAIERPTDMWQSNSMVSLSVVTARGEDCWWSGPIDDWEIQDGIDIEEVQILSYVKAQ